VLGIPKRTHTSKSQLILIFKLSQCSDYATGSATVVRFPTGAGFFFHVKLKTHII